MWRVDHQHQSKIQFQALSLSQISGSSVGQEQTSCSSMSVQKHKAKFLHKLNEDTLSSQKKTKGKKPSKRCTSQGKKTNGSSSLGTKVNGNKCNRRQVYYEQCKQLSKLVIKTREKKNQTHTWLSNNRDLESAVFCIGRSVMTNLS